MQFTIKSILGQTQTDIVKREHFPGGSWKTINETEEQKYCYKKITPRIVNFKELILTAK